MKTVLALTEMYVYILRNDFYAFVQRAFLELFPGKEYVPSWYLEVLAAKLEEVRRGTCRRLIVNMPPRMLKSYVVSVCFTAWLLGHNPSLHIMSVSYAQDLSDNFARKVRALMNSLFYQAIFPTRISKEREAVSDFDTTDGGCRFATSMAGVVTGRGADVAIVDDPLKADEAHSEARRGSVNRTYDDTMRTRLNRLGRGATVIVMQRLHADDLVAHVQQHETWDVLSFPAIAEKDETFEIKTPYGRKRIHRKRGDILEPALLSPTELETMRRTMTEYNFVAQFQQNPQPASGIIVKREWLRFYGSEEKPERFDHIVQSWDTANKDTELSNYSVCTTWGVKDHKLFLLDVYRHKLEFPELKRAVKELANIHGATIVLIEDKASGTSLIQELHRDHLSLVQAAPSIDGDKVMRLRAQTAKIEGGFVLFPKRAHWLGAYIGELISFPNAKYDDQVDSTVFALAWSTLDRPYGWTDKNLNNFAKFNESLATDLLFGIMAGRPW